MCLDVQTGTLTLALPSCTETCSPALLCRRELWLVHISQPLSPAEEEFLFELGAHTGVILRRFQSS